MDMVKKQNAALQAFASIILALAALFSPASALAVANACPIPGAHEFAQVAWPGSYDVAAMMAAGQAVPFTTNIAGYTNSVTLTTPSPSTLAGGPTTWTATFPLTGAGPLNNASLSYIDYRHPPTGGQVTYTFAVPLTSNDGVLVTDVDFTENVTLQFYDASGALLPTSGWSAAMIRDLNPGEPNATLTINATDINVAGVATNTADGAFLLTPPAGQAVASMVLSGSVVGAANGSWDINFVHGACNIDAVDNDYSATPFSPITGGTTPSILGNDTVGAVTATSANVTPTLLSNGGLTGLTLNANGTLTVPAGAAPGAYVASYQICDAAVPASCDSATVTVAVIGAADDSSLGNALGSTVTLNVLGNDFAPSAAALNPATVTIVGSAGAGQPLLAPGEGTWQVNTTTGAISFVPQPGFMGNPSPIQYTVQDSNGVATNAATVTVSYLPPSATSVPTLSTWALILAAISLAWLALGRLRPVR